jgi:hypothetical protein
MNRLACSVLQIGALLLATACAPSTNPDNGVAPPLVADTVLYVGARVPVYSLMLASGGVPYSPAPTTHARIIAGTRIDLADDTVSALYYPGAIVVQVSDDVAKWVRTFRIGVVWDLRRAWQFSSLCRTAEGVAPYDYTNTLSSFVTTQPTTLAGYPRWGADDRPSVAATVTGTWTDSVFHFYLHSDNHVRPDTAVVHTASVVNTLVSDSSITVRYTLANGASAAIPGGPVSWASAGVVFSGAGPPIPCRANLDALTSPPAQ